MKTLHATHADSQRRQNTIIYAALICFVEKGFTDTSIADICRKAEASTGSVYHHFKSKSGLAAAVYLNGISDYQRGMLAALEKHTKAKEGVFALVAFHLSWVARHSEWARFLFQHRHAEFMGREETEKKLNQLNAVFAGGMAGWFKKHIDAGRFRSLPRDIFISLLMGPCQEYARQYLSGHTVSSIESATLEIAKGAWAALRPDVSADS